MTNSILAYPLLSPDERRSLEVQVAGSPEYAPLLDEMRHLADLLDEVRRRDADIDAAAFLAAARSVEPATEPYDQQFALTIETDPALHAAYREFANRVKALEQDINPFDHFERLTGIVVKDDTQGRQAVREPIPPPSRSRRFARPVWAIAATLAVFAVAGTLLITEWQSTSEWQRLGAFRSDEVSSHRYLITARSADSVELAPTDSLLLDAIGDLQRARTTRYGFLPTYSVAHLRSADSLLSIVIDELPDENYVALEARYLRAKSSLIAEDVAAAVGDLQAVVDHEGARSARARDLLGEIRSRLDD